MTDKEAEVIIYEDLGMCGCGNPDIVLEFVHRALRIIKQRNEWTKANKKCSWRDDKDWEKIGKRLDKLFQRSDHELFYWMAWYFIKRAGLLNYGGCVNGSWLTEKGEDFLQYLNTHSIDKILNPHY